MLATRLFCNTVHHPDSVFVAGSSLATLFLGIADGENENVCTLGGLDSCHHVMRTGVVFSITEDEQRPRFHCGIVHLAQHAPFRGFNRAQAAVIEAAILTSRLHMLPREKIESELAYLEIAVGKTAGPIEQEAWDWLMEKIRGANPVSRRT